MAEYLSVEEPKEIKKQLSDIIIYINNENVILTEEARLNLKLLRLMWNEKNKSHQRYHDMKQHHSWITGCLSKMEGSEVLKLWNKYLQSISKFRLSNMRNVYRRFG